MSFLVRCALCGCVVLAEWDSGPESESDSSSGTSWANQFRALLHTPDGLLLTGIGNYDGPNLAGFRAPFDRDMHWSEPGFEPSDDNSFAVLPQQDFEGRHGIVFHDACWSLLEAALYPASVSLPRLFDICSSFPVPCNFRAPSWGYDFGGAAVVDKTTHFPWEDRYEDIELTEVNPAFRKNPYQVPGVDRLLAEDPQQPPAAIQPAQGSVLDCFASLPGELCATIAMLLPTADVLRARLASRAFWPVFYSQQFWASRFTPLPATDRSWLFETRHLQSPRDWRWLYRRTSDICLSPGLRNRRRIWGLIAQIAELLALLWNELPASLPEIWSLNSTLCTTEYRAEVNGLLWNPREPGDHRFYNGCRLFRTQSIAIPDSLTQVSVYTVALGDGQYIVGISLTTLAGDTIHLGYSSNSKQSIALSQVLGFRVAIGSRGLQALQCITGLSGLESAWLGSPDDVPRTERLVFADRVVGLEVGFDACKIVSLAVRIRLPSSQHRGKLRDLAVWYPTIPPRNLCLNEESFLPRDFYIVGYKPLFWCHFGGPGGKYLQYLTGISAVSNLGILRIYFSFDTDVSLEHRSFGRMKLNEEYEETTDFSIDGPSGERIETIKTRYCYPDPGRATPKIVQEGTMVRCELYTNRGRSCCIFKIKHKRGAVHTKVTAAPGTVITGLYATESPEECDDITAMGVITEDIGEADDA